MVAETVKAAKAGKATIAADLVKASEARKTVVALSAARLLETNIQ